MSNQTQQFHRGEVPIGISVSDKMTPLLLGIDYSLSVGFAEAEVELFQLDQDSFSR